VPVASLAVADSPRLSGEDEEHVQAMVDSEGPLPPLVVHRQTMRVIDGMHRLRAAVAKGEADVQVRFFDGDDGEAFLLAVRANLRHGLPLTSADRQAAAVRVIALRPEWSDRAVASATNLSPKTVAAVRRRAFADQSQARVRTGQDGRTRPLDATEGRIRAGRLIAEMPDASLREIAREAGVSPETVRNVRERLRTGQDPVPPRLKEQRRKSGGQPRQGERPPGVVLRSLRQDPSLRFNESGRALLRLLDAHILDGGEWGRLADSVPEHLQDAVSSLAQECADRWRLFAEELGRQHDASAS
jgi:hypothetical protein